MENTNTFSLDLKVLKLLDEFENKLENVAAIPLTGKIMIDREDILEIVREINILLPEEYQHVKWIKSQKTQIIDEAQRRAEGVLENAQIEERLVMENLKKQEQEILYIAEERARDMVEESEIVLAANKRAEEIIAEAESVAAEIAQNAYDYAEDLLRKVSGDVNGVLDTINNNLMELQSYKADDGYEE